MAMKQRRTVRLRRRILGITLVELMIVVVIVAVLGTIAIPSYRRYAIRAQRAEAKAALLQLAANQERYYTQNGNSFTTVLANINMPAVTENQLYQLRVTAATPSSFTAEARAINEMTADADCQVFTIDAEGVRGASPDPRGDCWP